MFPKLFPTHKGLNHMSVGTPIGTAGFATPILKTALDVHPHLNKKHDRPDFRGAPTPEEPLPPRGAPMRGSPERRQISSLEAATTQSRLDLTGDAMPTQESIAALLARLDSLQAIYARLDKLDAAIANLSLRVETLDGNATGEQL
jgi:hypothetical protein